MLLSCSKNVVVTETEYFRSQAFKSQEFKDLKAAYHHYLDYGKKHYTARAIKMYRDKPFLRDTILHYSHMRDSLLTVLKAKSDGFYAKYPSKSLNIDPDDLKILLAKN